MQKEAPGHSSTKLEGEEQRYGRKGGGWTGAEEVFSFSLLWYSLSMLSSLAEVIEVAIRAEYQVSSAETQLDPRLEAK